MFCRNFWFEYLPRSRSPYRPCRIQWLIHLRSGKFGPAAITSVVQASNCHDSPTLIGSQTIFVSCSASDRLQLFGRIHLFVFSPIGVHYFVGLFVCGFYQRRLVARKPFLDIVSEFCLRLMCLIVISRNKLASYLGRVINSLFRLLQSACPDRNG